MSGSVTFWQTKRFPKVNLMSCKNQRRHESLKIPPQEGIRSVEQMYPYKVRENLDITGPMNPPKGNWYRFEGFHYCSARATMQASKEHEKYHHQKKAVLRKLDSTTRNFEIQLIKSLK